MEMMKKICSLVTLMVLVLTQCFTSMNYALAENDAEQDFQVEENVNQVEEEVYTDISEWDEESKDTLPELQDNEEVVENILDSAAEMEDEWQDIENSWIDTESADKNVQNTLNDTENEEQNIENPWIDAENQRQGEEDILVNVEDQEENIEVDGQNIEDLWIDTGNGEENVENELVDVESEEQNIETDGEDVGDSSTEINDKNEEWIIGTISGEIREVFNKIRYFFKKEWDSRYIKYGKDENNIWTITLKDPKTSASVTIMDKNLWAESVGVDKNSYWYYFQWWNNHGLKTVDSSNRTTQKAVYKDSYYSHGYDGEWKFIVWGTDYWENWAHYNSLWWNESKESSRYGACPTGYHIPTMKEWNQLLDIWWKIHTQDTSKSEMVLRYSANYSAKNIHTFKWAATQCGQWDTECVDEDKLSVIIDTLSSELKLPLAGSYDENGNFHDGLWVYWTSISKDGNKAWVFSVDAYIWNWTDDTLMYKSQWHNIRCFQNVEPYEAPVEIEEEENLQEWQGQEDQDDKETQEWNTENQEWEVEQEWQQEQIQKDIPAEFISRVLVLDTTKDFMNVELNANGWKFSDEEESKTVKYGYYNQEATIDVNALKQDEYRSGYDVENEVEELQSIPVWYKLMDEIEIPTRYWYIFDGWYTESEWWEKIDFETLSVSEWMKVYAHWTLKEYTITWKNEDGTIRDTTKVAYGQIPTHEDITQPADEKYTYIFKWWEPEIKEVTWDAEYRATYTYTLRKYTVTWKNEDETVLKTNEVEYGTVPTYDGGLPTKESTEEFEYVFTWWDKEIGEVKWNVEYIARYDAKEIENEGIEDLPILSQDDENNTSWTLGGWSESYVWEWWTEQDSSDILEWQENSQEDENFEENQWFFGWLWETLKSFFLDDEDGYLRGSETIDDIVVSVEAEKWTFPEGTEVVIKWVSQERLESIQNSLIEDENNSVTEDAQILAFDISFVYSGEEIQPVKEVSVKFNYKENSDFQWSSMSELSVYHIDDETDEWEEVEVVNKDGDEIEILSASFSTFAVVAQKWLRSTPVTWIWIMDQMPDFEFTGIVINRPDSISNGPVFYIIMDRNLWATSTDTNNTDSYGYMYQWWNNYGFTSSWTSLPSDQVASKRDVAVHLTWYWPVYNWETQYYSGVFIVAPDKQGISNRIDWATTSNNNIWWDITDIDEARQWPCPSGWHVPSMTEWSGAMAYWKAWSWNWSLNNFANYLHLPKAGSRARSTADLQKSGQWWYYTSTPDWDQAYSLNITAKDYPQIYKENNRVDAQSIRCFKDELICEAGMHAELNGCVSNYKTWHCMTWDVQNGHYTWYMDEITIEWTWWTWYVPMCEIVCDEGFHENDNMCIWGFVSVTFDLNWWRWYDGSIWNRDSSIEMGVDISEVRPKQDPYKNGYMFMWWFDESSNSSYRFKFQWTTITWDLTLTAHWAPFNDIVYTWIIDGNERKIVLMDRNMWATAIWVWRNASTDSYGFYYEWWNNYGFYFDPSKTINSVSADNARVNAGWYGPNTSSWRYYGETFINITDSNRLDWSSVVNNNLWWWWWDNATNDYDNRTSERYTRQWPCPKGYHVPSLGEWRDLVRLFYNNNWLGNFSQPWPDYVWTAGGNAMKDEPISTTNRDIFANTFNIPVAWRVQRTYVWERYWNKDNKPRAPFWSSSIKNWNGSLWFEVKFDGEYINIWWWNDERSQLKPVRCFKDLDDYTVTWKNYNGTVLETDDYVYQWATPTYNGLEDPIKDELSEFVWWYLEWDENQTIVDLSTESVDSDRAYVAKFIPIAPEDAYIVTVDIDPLVWWHVDKELRYNSGDTVTLTWIANSWYEFLWWFTGNDIVSLDNPYVFTADDSDGTGFTAVFSPLYSIYTGTNNESWWIISYEVVDITRQWKLIRFTATPTEDFELDKWIVNWNDVATWGSTQLDMILSWNINLTGYFVQVANLPCNFNGETIPNGESVTWYQSDSVTCPNTCISQVATCNNGEWNMTNFETEYSYSACNYSWFTCSTEEYSLQTCPENWICSSCTGYTVNENACVQWTPIYKLESCSGHYHVSGDVCEINTYEITWTYRNLSGEWVTNTWNYARWSNFTPILPTYPKTLQTKYTFVWWEPELAVVTEDTWYTAIYTEEPRPYTITFVSSGENYGTVSPASVTEGYGTQILINNDTITISWTTVTATATWTDAQYTYTFSGWNNTCGNTIAWDCTIIAEFSSSVNEYLITFQNEDWTPLQTWMVAYGDTPVYSGATPQKAPSWIYAYIFTWWNPTISEVSGNATYTAVFDRTLSKYDVTWKNIDGTVLKVDKNVGKWAMPEYIGPTPTNWVSNQYFTSTFAWWNPALAPVVKNVEYMARYTYTVASGLVLDTSKDSVNVTLNANGWEFSNNSWYDILNYGYYNRAEKQYSHSSNYSDDWIRNTSAINADDGQYLTTITWAEYLYLNLTYDLHEIWLWLANSNKDKLYVYAWTSLNDELVAAFSWNTNDWIQGNESFIISGDSVLLDFYLVNRNITDVESNWFYAVIVWVIPVWYRTTDEVEIPTREWYTFDGWYTQQQWWESIDLTGWSISGNIEVYAHWTPNNVLYTVYHYVKRVWQSTYELAETQTWYETTDSTLILSWLAKESEFVCAHYSRWSLTWTENWPWEIVTETTIRWDGTTEIYLYYVRSSHTVTLVPDEHTASVTWDGVRECGSEVPIDATPDPWYHFVRWDREARRGRSGGSEWSEDWEYDEIS